MISEAGCKLLDDLLLRLDLLEQQCASVRSNRSTVKLGDYIPPSAGLKDQPLASTHLSALIAPFLWSKVLFLNRLYHEKELFYSDQ